MNGLRTLGNNTPILNSWAGDGNYWYTQDPKVSNYYYVTFASAFGDDPVPAVKALAEAERCGDREGREHRSLRHGPCRDRRCSRSPSSARAGTRTAKRSRRRWRSSENVPTLSGLVSFSKTLHTVYGRQYRVIRVQNNVPKVVGTIKAKVVPKI